ncbi:MAG: SpoIIE family protein phosphatase [Phycisphaerae bacterium]|nr:SpoIIE family protein phosphatase [Phycisphaerales bacterium]
MHIVVTDAERPTRGFDFSDEVELIRVGSTSDCDLFLPDVRVAEEHFQIRKVDGVEWILEHCEIPADSPAEYTRTYVNSIESNEAIRLRHNDEILIARFRLKVFLDNSSALAPRSAIVESASKIREHPLPHGAAVRGEAGEALTLPPGMVSTLADIAFEINQCADLSSLMGACIKLVQQHFSTHQVWVGTRRRSYGRLEFVETRLEDGSIGGDPHLIDTFVYRCTERGQQILCSKLDAFPVGSLMCVPLVADRGVLGMIYLDQRRDGAPFGRQEFDSLVAMGAVIAKHLDRIVADQVELQESIKAGQLSFVRELQSLMDPTNVPQWEGLQMAMYCKPGLDSSGDIFDVMRLPNTLASFVCGHVKGHATNAALAMAQVRAAFRLAGLHADPPHVLFRALNWILHDPQRPCEFSAAGFVMNPKTGAMQFATAGDIGAVVVGAGGQLRSLVQESMPAIGATREHAYTGGAGRVEDGETLVLYTPGCWTVANEEGKSIGRGQLINAISDLFGQPASSALDELLSDFRAYFALGRQPDDVTFMILHRE